jgi:hypothetical protein
MKLAYHNIPDARKQAKKLTIAEFSIGYFFIASIIIKNSAPIMLPKNNPLVALLLKRKIPPTSVTL